MPLSDRDPAAAAAAALAECQRKLAVAERELKAAQDGRASQRRRADGLEAKLKAERTTSRSPRSSTSRPFVGKLGYRALVAPDFGFPRATPLASSPLRPAEAPTRSVRGLVHVLRSHAALTLWSVDAARRKILRGAAGSSALRSRASGGARCAAAARAASFEAGGRCRAAS